MTPTWEPDGFFELSDSDNHVGSLYSIEDMMTILSIPSTNKELFTKQLKRRKLLDDANRIKEPQLFKKGKIKGENKKRWIILMESLSTEKPLKSQTLSELELIALIKKAYGTDVVVDAQKQIGNYFIDIKATINNKNYYIDFLGPRHHFENDEDIDNDFKRKSELEQQLNTRIIEWPYWIQFCERNVRIAFGENLKGKGAIWGSEIFWGGLSEKIKNRILELSKSFNAIHGDGIGYFYELWEENGCIIKPAHPIIDMIKSGKKSIDLLLPANLDVKEKKYWLPKELWGLIH